jgi:hypothetical protein
MCAPVQIIPQQLEVTGLYLLGGKIIMENWV